MNEELDYLLAKELEGRLDTLVSGLARGAPADYPEYCKLVGEFRGVRYALDALIKFRQEIRGVEDE
jgi:hypothetical protein